MKTLKITEIGKSANLKKYDFWNEVLAQSDFKIEPRAVELSDLAKLKIICDEAKKNSDLIRFDKDLWGWVPTLTTHEPTAVSYGQSADGMAKDGNFWLPRDMVSVALKSLAVSRFKSLSYKGNALIVGCNGPARIAAQTAAAWGFKKISFVPETGEDMNFWIEEFRAHFFGLELNIIDPQTVTLQPGNTSLLINTLEHKDFPDVLTDIYYFNFLRKEGAVIDMVPSAAPTQLIQESKRIGVNVVEGHEISFQEDQNWFLRFKPDLRLEKEKLPELLEKYRSLLS